LAEKLVEMTPLGLDRCFYADNGSAAVEVALKDELSLLAKLRANAENQIYNVGK